MGEAVVVEEVKTRHLQTTSWGKCAPGVADTLPMTNLTAQPEVRHITTAASGATSEQPEGHRQRSVDWRRQLTQMRMLSWVQPEEMMRMVCGL